MSGIGCEGGGGGGWGGCAICFQILHVVKKRHVKNPLGL